MKSSKYQKHLFLLEVFCFYVFLVCLELDLLEVHFLQAELHFRVHHTKQESEFQCDVVLKEPSPIEDFLSSFLDYYSNVLERGRETAPGFTDFSKIPEILKFHKNLEISVISSKFAEFL